MFFQNSSRFSYRTSLSDIHAGTKDGSRSYKKKTAFTAGSYPDPLDFKHHDNYFEISHKHV
jgi:hypothetical protein